MAIMIPETPREFVPASLEGELFEALKTLSNDYYIIHSFNSVFVKDNTLHESETDFVVFNRRHGILCIEAKAGKVQYKGGKWLYSSGLEMKHGGPYNQAAKNRYRMIDLIYDSALKDLSYKCKVMHAVWFPSVKRCEFTGKRFVGEVDWELTLSMEDLTDPKERIESIFSIELQNHIKTDLSESDEKRLLKEIICPEFNIFPTKGFENDLKKIVFHRLLKEQQNILNYLVDQRTAVISGAAGTGKTMIAVEKANRHASDGEKVLFLCYNAFLRENLESRYKDDNIDFMTIDGFVCKICRTATPDYKRAADKILDYYISGAFPYKHVIVDEGQDFGKENIEEADILQSMAEVVVENEGSGSFYVFYDELQLVQSSVVPKFITEADCKLKLYKNCRNTESIANTSMKPICRREPKMYEGAVIGIPPKIHFIDGDDRIREKVDMIISGYKDDGIEDVTILTSKTEDHCAFKPYIKDGKYNKFKVTTCRKFKGLESDAIIMMDVTASSFMDDNVLLYYVGASRARLRLDIITTMTDDECRAVLTQVICYEKKIKKPKRDLASALKASAIVE